MSSVKINWDLTPIVLALWVNTSWAKDVTKAWPVTVLEQSSPPAWERSRLERAYLGHPGGSVRVAVSMALEDAKFDFESSKTSVVERYAQVDGIESAKAAAQKAAKEGSVALLVNLPAAWVSAVAQAVKLPVLNLAAQEDSLRGADCAATLYHLIPSERMRADALAQSLASRKWGKVLLLSGPSAQDAMRSAVALAALKRYGLKVQAERPFKLSTDPRERQLANPLLLTGGVDYDAVWVVDSDGEFARSLPYNTALPRPVVGDAGLVALAWHPQFERFGAPQLSRRFMKAAKRPMTDVDWAAWLAARAVAQMVSGSQNSAATHFSSLNLDGYKGVSLQFRAWDRQLRQPLLLSDGQGVVSMAPVEGVLHPRHVLDTLGADEAEKQCLVNSQVKP